MSFSLHFSIAVSDILASVINKPLLPVPPYPFTTLLNLSISVIRFIWVLHSTNNILVPDVYIDTFSLIENPNQIYLCKEGKRVDTIQIEYNKDKITFTHKDGKVNSTISNTPKPQDANLEEKEREV